MLAFLALVALMGQIVFALLIAYGVRYFLNWNISQALLLALGLILGVRILATQLLFAHARKQGRLFRDTPLRKPLGALKLYAQESWVTLLTSSYYLPFRRFRYRQTALSPQLPVLLIHGYFANSGYWRALSAKLSAANIPHLALDCEPLLGNIERYSDGIQAAIQTLKNTTTKKQVVLLCHSMGGLSARAFVRHYGANDIAHIITLGTPHQGTQLANAGWGINTQQMRPRSPWLLELEASENAQTRALFTSIYSCHDNVVVPQSNAYLRGAQNIEVQGVGHVSLALDAYVQQLILQQLSHYKG